MGEVEAVADKTSFQEICDEIIDETVEIINELFAEEIFPLLKYRQQLEKKEFEKAYREVKELEAE